MCQASTDSASPKCGGRKSGRKPIILLCTWVVGRFFSAMSTAKKHTIVVDKRRGSLDALCSEIISCTWRVARRFKLVQGAVVVLFISCIIIFRDIRCLFSL